MSTEEYKDLIKMMIRYLNLKTPFYYRLYFTYFVVSKMDIDGHYTEQKFTDYECVIKWLASEIDEHTHYNPMMEWQ